MVLILFGLGMIEDTEALLMILVRFHNCNF